MSNNLKLIAGIGDVARASFPIVIESIQIKNIATSIVSKTLETPRFVFGGLNKTNKRKKRERKYPPGGESNFVLFRFVIYFS